MAETLGLDVRIIPSTGEACAQVHPIERCGVVMLGIADRGAQRSRSTCCTRVGSNLKSPR
jgi:hypothetical protein